MPPNSYLAKLSPYALLASVLELSARGQPQERPLSDLDASRATLVGLGFDRLDQRCFEPLNDRYRAAARLRALRG